MVFEAMLDEVGHLNNVGTRLEGLAERNPSISEPLLSIAANIRNIATVLAILVATKRPKPV